MKYKLLEKVAALFLAVFILSSSVILTLSFKKSYDFTVNSIKQDGYNLSVNTMKENYYNLIDYMFKDKDEKLKFKELPMSREGEIHFYEVKLIFRKFMLLTAVSLVITVFSALLLIKAKQYNFLKKGAYLVLIIPALLSLPAIIDFNYVFIKFHELAFDNDYWIFDPIRDPIINYLPESLFFINLIIILLLIILMVMMSLLLRRYLLKRKNQ